MPISVVRTPLPGVLILEPKLYGDARGSFFESFNQREFAEATGRTVEFVQDNQSSSVRGVLRGLHYQVVRPQGKLVRVLCGEVFDVVVDLRRSSPTFAQHFGVLLSAENRRQLWVPEGFAHGFQAVSDAADVLYKTTDYWCPEHERSLRWDAPELDIAWPLSLAPILAAKDAAAPTLRDAEVYP